jgi:hypothetical protein
MFFKYINFCTYAQAVDRSRGIGSNGKEAMSGLPGTEKQKRPNLAISSFKKGQIFKLKKGQIKAKFQVKFA